MKLSEIISNLKVLQTIGDTERNIERINLACPRETLKEGLRRIARLLSQYTPDEAELGCPM